MAFVLRDPNSLQHASTAVILAGLEAEGKFFCSRTVCFVPQIVQWTLLSFAAPSKTLLPGTLLV